MSLRALAFGPLPQSQVQASQQLSLPQPGRRTTAPSGDEVGDTGQGFDAALTVGGPLREPEAFNPVFPDLYGAEPGSEQETDFTSDTVQDIASPAAPPRQAGVPPAPQQSQGPDQPDAWRTDLDSAFKALRGLSSGIRAFEGTSEGVGGGLGAAGSLYGLARAAEAGNPVGIAGGALGAYAGITNAAGVSPLASSLVALSPEAAGAVITALGGAAPAAGASTQALTSALSTTIGGTAAAAAPIIQGVIEYLQHQEQKRDRMSGWANNPIAGGLHTAATTGHQNILSLLAQQQAAGGLENISTDDLANQLAYIGQGLYPSYASVEGPKRPVKASDAMAGMFGRPGIGGEEVYNANLNQSLGGLDALVRELSKRGYTAEQFGALPGEREWGGGGLGGQPVSQAQYAQTPNLGSLGAGEAATLGAGFTPGAVNEITGGPVLSMLAYLNPELYKQIGGAFSYGGPTTLAELARQKANTGAINSAAYEGFTSGGG